MSLLHKPLVAVVLDDVENLISNKVSESRNLDYKLELPDLSNADAKREFLYDVSALANGGGGELIFGVDEERVNGRPSGRPAGPITGVTITNPDALRLSLENLIRDCIAPRIIGLQMRAIPTAGDTFVFLIRVPRSLSAPHMVTMGGQQRFYTRNSGGKHPMDISELRAAFMAGGSFVRQADDWRRKRLSLIANNQGATRLLDGAKIVLHLIPLASADAGTAVDLTVYEQQGASLRDVEALEEQSVSLKPFYTTGWDGRFNLDGYMTFSNFPRKEVPHTYVQFFRTGQIESVDMGILHPDGETKYVPSIKYEKDVIDHVRKYLTAMERVLIQPPIMIGLSFLGMRGYQLAIDPRFVSDRTYEFDSDNIILPGVLVEDWQANVPSVLKPVFDSVWNAFGWPGSKNYGTNGEWRPYR